MSHKNYPGDFLLIVMPAGLSEWCSSSDNKQHKKYSDEKK